MASEELKTTDIKELSSLIKSVGNLDLNSSYLYLLLARYFSKDCLVKKVDDKIIGFITAIKTDENTLFIWQVGVSKNFQGKGFAKELLQDLIVKQPKNITLIEFSISPSNQASFALFNKYATNINTKVLPVAEFKPNLFFEDNHEEEIFYQIKLGTNE
jgi:L-2,4-diaminobutyric acid acetyltransferase